MSLSEPKLLSGVPVHPLRKSAHDAAIQVNNNIAQSQRCILHFELGTCHPSLPPANVASAAQTKQKIVRVSKQQTRRTQKQLLKLVASNMPQLPE